MQSIVKILIPCLTVMLLACEADIAPNNSTLTVTPASLSVPFGNTGDTSFGYFVVDLANEKGIPLDSVTVTASTVNLRLVDADGNLVNRGIPTNYTTDENGQINLYIEVPLGADYTDILLLQSGGTSASVTITGTVSGI